METGSSLSKRFNEYRPTKTLLFWYCAGTAIAVIVVGFAWGGWVTGGKAHAMAEDAANGARDGIMASLCVDQFKAGPDMAAQLVTLKGLTTWNRSDFIQKGGWAAMPNDAKFSASAAKLCGDQLAAL
jgi:hypothetical protein